MANLARVRVSWTGAPVVGPGVSTLYMDETGSGWSADLVTFFGAIANRFPTGLTWTIPSSGDLIDVATGELSGTWSGESGGAVAASGGNGYVQGAGCSIEWQTAGIRNGRRVLGRTFLCPLDNGAWSTSGVLNGAVVTALNSALNAYLSANPWGRIYSRPTATNPTGAMHDITSGGIPVTVSWLRSRRT